MSDLTKPLLLELKTWCEAKHGRKAEVARFLEIDPQALSNLFAGRQKLTGHQALAIQAFLKANRRRKT